MSPRATRARARSTHNRCERSLAPRGERQRRWGRHNTSLASNSAQYEPRQRHRILRQGEPAWAVNANNYEIGGCINGVDARPFKVTGIVQKDHVLIGRQQTLRSRCLRTMSLATKSSGRQSNASGMQTA